MSESEARARAVESAFEEGVKEGYILCAADIKESLDVVLSERLDEKRNKHGKRNAKVKSSGNYRTMGQ